MQRAAVIDMGSNSFRLVVYGYEPGRYWHLVDEIREAVRVGKGMGADGMLQSEPMERAAGTARMFAAFCTASGIDDVTAVATSAIRDAGNGPDLLARIREESGLEARVLSGEEEARYGYLAIANQTTLADGYRLDIGGGPGPVMRSEGRNPGTAGSWP